jgi:S1-C subfamily serine protease
VKGRERTSARVLGNAPCDDLAVLELDSSLEGVPAVSLGDSDAVKNSEEVTALGSDRPGRAGTASGGRRE